MLKIFYCDEFVLPLPEQHRFPMEKYRQLRLAVQNAGIVPSENIRIPPGATDEQLLRVHTREYLEKVKKGELSDKEIRRMGFPWSDQLVERARRSVGGTIASTQSAMKFGYGVNLAGGTHHAHADWGQGFCVFNDAVVAARHLQSEGLVKRVAIIDCDVHQGNGTAALTCSDPSIFTLSLHGEKNFPFHKAQSDIDVALEDGASDDEYLAALDEALDTTLTYSQAELVIYLAGADPFVGDRLGKLALTKDGLLARDELVLERCRHFGVPVATVMAGGYAKNIDDIVEIHLGTVRTVAQFASKS